MTPEPHPNSQIHPELRSTYRFQPPLPAHRAAFVGLARGATTLLPDPTPLEGVIRRVHTVAASGMQVRVFYPDHPDLDDQARSAALLWIHGGGFILGAAVQDDIFCMLVATAMNIPVVSVEYRLAPAHPFPAALDDCHDAWDWMIRNARSLGIDSSRIAIAGQSAGGGLAAALVNRLHNRLHNLPHATGPQPRAQWLLSPMLDDRTAAKTDLDRRNHPVWNNRSNRYGWSSYLDIPLAEVGSVDAPPEAVPARGTAAAGLPPTWIGVGTIDLFHDEDTAYAEALSGAGVDTTLVTVPGAPHGFETLALRAPVSVAYLRKAYTWLGIHLAPTHT